LQVNFRRRSSRIARGYAEREQKKRNKNVKIVNKTNVPKTQANEAVATLKVRVSKGGATELALAGQLVGAQIETALEALAEAAGPPEEARAATDLACG
jgi:hypothetical protein